MAPITFSLRALVRAYQLLLRPLLPPACRHHPSCSRYAIEALERHGALEGGWLALWRVLRCHPWAEGGFDPVPEPRERISLRERYRDSGTANAE